MLIGLDFDNTIACYSDVFSLEAKFQGLVHQDWEGSKEDLKFLLGALEDGQTKWQKIQGQVYGPSMHKATLFPGVARFLLRCRLEGHSVYIVSHKTKYGHFDKTKTLLRETSLKWMEDQGFFNKTLYGINKQNVFFANNQTEKVLKIKSLNLDFFIDDLEEIFLHHDFPDINKILFSRSTLNQSNTKLFNNWTDIETASIGEIENSEFKNLLSFISGEPINNVEKLKGRGNSRIYKLSINKKNTVLLKNYPDLSIDSRPRMLTEVNALNLLEVLGRTPKVLYYDKSQNVAFYEWIKGESLYKIKNYHIEQALSFIENIQSIKGKESCDDASEACFSATQLMNQINLRLEKLLKTKNKDLNEFLLVTFIPLLKEVWEFSKKNWPTNNLKKELPMAMQILSPSDFGFHNTILKESGNLVFLDFEYFGLDDPVKLIADFIWHPGMKLNNTQKSNWVRETFSIFKKDPDLVNRFRSVWPLYGLRWSLIVLNEYLEEGWHKRAYANDNLRYSHKKKLISQLIKAKDICNKISLNNMKCPYIVELNE